MTRTWRERDHPRWPEGTPGGRGGEFRDRNGGDWVDRLGDRLGDALPAGRYGSIATGQTAQCPVCGRTVKVVGTQGKLSTHNSGPGQRCGGSGQGTLDTDRTAGGVRQRRAKKPPKNTEIKAPEPPKVTPGSSKDKIDYDIARRRFQRWQDGAAAPETRQKQREKTRREWEIENTEREVKDLDRAHDRARARARVEVESDMRRGGYNPLKLADRDWWGYDDEIDRRTKHEHDAWMQAVQYLAALRNRTPIPDQQGVRLGIGGYPRKQWTETELDEMVSAGVYYAPIQDYDPAHPLDIYGGMLHIGDDTWFTYQALDTLEQNVPPVFHEVVAAHLAHKRGNDPSAGIYVGAVPVPDLDRLSRLRHEKPRGWRKGETWQDVDGVVSGQSTLAVGYTPNTESARSENARAFGRSDDPDRGRRMDPSAMAHEFGHMLDAALGSGKRSGTRIWGSASNERQWRLIHGKVKRQGGRYLNPYFRQRDDAGPQELWADAFGVWAQASGEPEYWPDGRIHEVLVKLDSQGNGVKRTVTHRANALARMYDVPYEVAFEIEDYFDRLLKEVQSGKRKPRLQTAGY